MRAITVRQPWGWAIIHGGKDVENRSRNIAGAYRGPVVIHTARRFADEAILVPPLKSLPVDPFGIVGGLVRGAFIGVVDLVDVHRATPDDLGRIICRPGTPDWSFECSPWAQESDYHLVLENPRPLVQPIPAIGRLGLWHIDPADVERIERQMS